MNSLLEAALSVMTRLLKEVPGIENVRSRILTAGPGRSKGLIQTEETEIVIIVRKRK